MAKEIIPSDNIFYDIIQGISDNEDVRESVTNRPIEQLASNIMYLKRLIRILEQSQVSDIEAVLATKLDTSKLNKPNGVAGLDASGRLRPEQTPRISISETRTFGSLAERDTWNDPDEGDVAIIIGKAAYIRTAVQWQELPQPQNVGVKSVNNQVGDVVLTAVTVGAEPSFIKESGFNKPFGNSKNTVAEGLHTHDFSSITNKPNSYPPASHDHPIEEIRNLDTRLSQIVAKGIVTRQRFISTGDVVFTLADSRAVFSVTLNGVDLDDGEFVQVGNTLTVASSINGDIIISYRQG